MSWLVSRSDRVLMTWAIGALLIVISLLIYSEFVRQFSPPVGVLGFGTLLAGLTFLMGAGYQFRTGVLPPWNDEGDRRNGDDCGHGCAHAAGLRWHLLHRVQFRCRRHPVLYLVGLLAVARGISRWLIITLLRPLLPHGSFIRALRGRSDP